MPLIKRRLVSAILAIFLSALFLIPDSSLVLAQSNSQFFPETGKTVSGTILNYWRNNGNLAAFGYPITEAAQERNPEDGKTYLTQWFERNRLEVHPEFAGTPDEVLLGLLGNDLRREALNVNRQEGKIDPDFKPAEPLNKEGGAYFPETGHNIQPFFNNYWQSRGGLKRFGYPISEERTELDPETGKPFVMQWFERARFEFHPENSNPDFLVLLGLLGNEIKKPKPGTLSFKYFLGSAFRELGRPAGAAIDSNGKIFVTNGQLNLIETYGTDFKQIRRYPSVTSVQTNVSSLTGAKFGISGVAIDRENNVYVTDLSNRKILKYNNEMLGIKEWGSRGSGNSQFEEPSAVATDANNNVFVTDFTLNRVQKFDKEGNFLKSWGSKGTGNGQFNGPQGIATDGQGNVWVADSQNDRFCLFDNNGGYKSCYYGFGSVGVRSPRAVAVDKDGNIYWGDTGNFKVYKFNPEKIKVAEVGGVGFYNGKFNTIQYISTDNNGNVYVVDAYNDIIQVFDKNLKYVNRIGTDNRPQGRFTNPFGITLDPTGSGSIFVGDYSNNRIQKFSTDGKPLFQLGEFGTTEKKFIGTPGVAYDNLDKAIYVSDEGNNRIQKFDVNGNFLFQFGSKGSGNGKLSAPAGIAVDQKTGFIIVADAGNHQIKGFQYDGSSGGFIGSKGSGNGQFETPVGVAIDKQGNFYVTDVTLNRVQKFAPNGDFLLKWGSTGSGTSRFNGPFGIYADDAGNIWVADTGNNRLQKFNSNGSFLKEYKFSTGSAAGQIQAIAGVVVDKRGYVYVTDYTNDRIVVFKQN